MSSVAAESGAPLRVAIVHDWLVTLAGAEWVLRDLLLAFPDATVFTTIDHMADQDRAALALPPTRTTWLQGVPGISRQYRAYLPVMPWAVSGHDLSGYDLVISNSHAVAKGIRPHRDQRHVCYCLSPMRYAWDLREQYLREASLDGPLLGPPARLMLNALRRWDRTTSARVDRFLTLSSYIADRIARAYGRSAAVVYPPVDTEFFVPAAADMDTGPVRVEGMSSAEEYYVTASRFVPYKRVDMIAAAFRRLPDKRLVIVGAGPDEAKVRAAAGPNVTLVGHTSRAELRRWLQGARGFVFAAEEDFGIAPVEAQACGVPVIAYARGGAVETIRGADQADPTGEFYVEQSAEALAEAIRRFEGRPWRSSGTAWMACRTNALRFARPRFRDEIRAAILAPPRGSDRSMGPGGFEPPHVGL